MSAHSATCQCARCDTKRAALVSAGSIVDAAFPTAGMWRPEVPLIPEALITLSLVIGDSLESKKRRCSQTCSLLTADGTSTIASLACLRALYTPSEQ